MAGMDTAAYGRISSLFDPGSFLETGAFVTDRSTAGTSEAAKNGDGVITGYGTIGGRLCFVYAQNADIAGGSLGEMHAKKISALYRQAVTMGAPVLAIIDCAGVRMNEGSDSLYSFGRLFKHQSDASGVIPQIALVYGTCGGGMAVMASMSDFVFMKDGADLFINSPNAVSGNFTEKLDTSDTGFQSSATGICDFHGSEEEITEAVKTLFEYLPLNNEGDQPEDLCEDDLNRSVSGIEKLSSKYEMLCQIADEGKVFEIRKDHASGLTTAFLRIAGRTVGAIANNSTEISHMECRKAIKFLNFCDSFNLPVLTLCDAEGFAKDMENETYLARTLGKLAYTYTAISVPSVTLITGKAYGTAGLVMGSKSLGTDLCFAYPDAKIGLMDEKVLKNVSGISLEKDVYSALYHAQRGYIDDIIDPAETRQRLAAAFEMLYSKSIPLVVRKHGTV